MTLHISEFELLLVDKDELWCIHDCVRQHDKLGQEWDKEFLIRVMQAIVESTAAPTGTAVLLCYEEELWQIDRQIPSSLMIGTKPVGRNLLMKTMKLLIKVSHESNADKPLIHSAS